MNISLLLFTYKHSPFSLVKFLTLLLENLTKIISYEENNVHSRHACSCVENCNKSVFLVRIRRFFLTWDTNDILCLFFSCRNLNKLSIKYQSHTKSRKIHTFGQEICLLPPCLFMCIVRKDVLKHHQYWNDVAGQFFFSVAAETILFYDSLKKLECSGFYFCIFYPF